MTLNEFKAKIDRLAARYGEQEVVVALSGVGGPRSSVTGIYTGIDWYNEVVSIRTADYLTHSIEDKKYHYLFRGYLHEISNLKKCEAGEKVAKFRKEVKQFDRSCDAVLWLYEKMKEEIKEKVG